MPETEGHQPENWDQEFQRLIGLLDDQDSQAYLLAKTLAEQNPTTFARKITALFQAKKRPDLLLSLNEAWDQNERTEQTAEGLRRSVGNLRYALAATIVLGVATAAWLGNRNSDSNSSPQQNDPKASILKGRNDNPKPKAPVKSSLTVPQTKKLAVDSKAQNSLEKK